MLRVPHSSVIGASKLELAARQLEIDGQAAYADRVLTARRLWKSKHRATFTEIRELLASLCQGARRCHYCEDSVADEVEHVWPKSIFPERTFRWSNYLFACGPCNGSYKGDQFSVLDATGQIVELKRKKDSPVVEPIAGLPLFIDPTVDDPLEFLELDVLTGIFVSSAPPGSFEDKRAQYTLKVLGLNERDFLSRARRNAYGSYLDSVRVYVEEKARGAPVAELKHRLIELHDRHHPSVWNEIKKLASIDGAEKDLFDQAPELYLI